MNRAISAADLRIGGFVPFSTVDFPGAISAVVFCQGCSLRCAYCHNPNLLDPSRATSLRWADIKKKLEARRDLVDAVVFSGGEPLLQRALPVAIKAAKSMGFKVALHTAGAAPIRLESIVRDLDWVGFDLKAQFSRYGALTGAPRGGQNARRSLAILAASGGSFEVRTTAWPGFHDPDDVAELARCAKAARAGAFVIQQARDPVSRRPVASPFFSDPSTVAGLRGEFPFLTLRPA